MSAKSTTQIPVKAIVAHHLRIHGYDGLYCPEVECGCFLADLMPCSSPSDACVPGYVAEDEDENVGIRPTKPAKGVE